MNDTEKIAREIARVSRLCAEEIKSTYIYHEDDTLLAAIIAKHVAPLVQERDELKAQQTLWRASDSVHRKTLKERDELRAQLEKAKDVLKFYAYDCWEYDEPRAKWATKALAELSAKQGVA